MAINLYSEKLLIGIFEVGPTSIGLWDLGEVGRGGGEVNGVLLS